MFQPGSQGLNMYISAVHTAKVVMDDCQRMLDEDYREIDAIRLKLQVPPGLPPLASLQPVRLGWQNQYDSNPFGQSRIDGNAAVAVLATVYSPEAAIGSP